MERGAPSTDAPQRGGRSFRRRVLSGPQTVEAYLRANSPPRYIQRLRAIETQFGTHRRRLEAAYAALREACGEDAALFRRRWRARAHRWRFDELNGLIREHNAWYPVEANLPMDPRTRDYVAVRGASYRRLELGPQWILEHLPATDSGGGSDRPRLPRLAPREGRSGGS